MKIELAIEQVGLMGQGVAKDTEGNIYFVPGAIPGDRVLASFDENAKKYRDAELEEVLLPSPDREQVPCAVFNECGGCDWLHWKYPAQLQAKETILRHVLERSGFLPEEMKKPVAAEQPFGYRNRIQLHGAGKRLGFYKRRTHDIVDISTCPVTHPTLNAELEKVRADLGSSANPYKVELALQEDGSVLRLVDQPHAAGGFAQVHAAQNDKLKALVSDLVRKSGSQSVLELYAGNGNLTFAYADQVEEVFAIELSDTALAQARERFGTRQKPRAAFLERRIDSRLVRSLPRDFRGRYDTLLLDPPRAGAEAVIEPLIHEGLKSVIYVSCSPVAFTKDVACLKENFRFEHIQIVDMFPHTRHIEFVAYFSRLLS